MEKNDKQLFRGFKYIDMHKPITWEVVAKEIKASLGARCTKEPAMPEHLFRLSIIDSICDVVSYYTEDKMCLILNEYAAERVSVYCTNPSSYTLSLRIGYIKNVRDTIVGALVDVIYNILYAMLERNIPVDSSKIAAVDTIELALPDFMPTAAYNLICLNVEACDFNVLLSLMQEWANKQDIDIMPFFLLGLIYRMTE